MNISICFTRQTVKMLIGRLQHAYRVGDLRLVRRVSALLDLARETTVAQVAEIYSVSRQAVYDWLKALMCHGENSLAYRRSPGRRPRLTKTQKQQLSALIQAGPQAAGFTPACWTSVLIQQLIQREFGVLYNRYYVCELLRTLGFSVQKARFVSDHLDEEARQRWWADTWPQIKRLAEEKQALLLFGDEVSFAQWGSLGYTWALKGHSPVVKTTGKRKGYKVWGLIEFFSGRFFYHGQQERFVSEGYQAFLAQILAQTSQHLILIQDGAKYHTSQSTRAFRGRQREHPGVPGRLITASRLLARLRTNLLQWWATGRGNAAGRVQLCRKRGRGRRIAGRLYGCLRRSDTGLGPDEP